MENKILLRANIKRHKGSLTGIFILTLLVAAALGTVISVWSNSNRYIQSELKRARFGELTAWVSGVPDMVKLKDAIEALAEVERVETQNLIYSSYTVNNQESDSEGQLIIYNPNENRYHFFTDDLSSYIQQPNEIESGDVYISPSMISMFGVKIGDEITFPIARSGRNITLTLKGFYEDPFMGSSMIGMKGFLISEADRNVALSIIQNSGIDALARDGAMLHIFPTNDSVLTVSALNSLINNQTDLTKYTESIHSRDAIEGFMLILQNAFSGLLIAFVAVLLVVVVIVISHSIKSTIDSDFVNMAILKTIGITSKKLRFFELLQYLIPIALGLILGFLTAIPLSLLISDITLTATGIRIPEGLPLYPCVIALFTILFLLSGFIILKTRKISKITPMKAIRGETDFENSITVKTPTAYGKYIHLRLAFRQLMSGKIRYIGAFVVAVLLVFFASLIGRINSWLGEEGKGMMDAFNPADHDIGIQSFGKLTQEEFENTIISYTNIIDTYMLAMPSIAVNGTTYTANVIDEPKRFHILEGRTCDADNEVVLTEFVAASFGVDIGDTVTLRGDTGSGEYIVAGIYSCANDMGNNIGMSREGYLKIGRDHPNLWCWHYFLSDPTQKASITQSLESTYGGDIHVHENTWPGLFGIISAMKSLIVFMYVMVIIFILIVTYMTGSKLLSVEQKDLGIYKAIGFSSNSLRLTFALRFGMVAVLGSIIGIVLAATLTDPLVSTVMKLAGISSFSSNPDIIGIALPSVIVTLLFTAFGWIISTKIEKIPLSILISK